MKLWKRMIFDRRRELRHEFVIGPSQRSYLSAKAGRLYYCRRCKWSFWVCGAEVVVLGDDGKPMRGSESKQRFDTFAGGPCPVLAAFLSDLEVEFYADRGVPHPRRIGQQEPIAPLRSVVIKLPSPIDRVSRA